MNMATDKKQRIVQIAGTSSSYRIDREPTDGVYGMTLMIPIDGGVVEFEHPVDLGDVGVISGFTAEHLDMLLLPLVSRMAAQIESKAADLKVGATSMTIVDKSPFGEMEVEIQIRLIAA